MILLGDDMKKGFTLVEMMAVILLIGLLTAFAIPAVVNQVGKKSEEVDKLTEEIIYSASELYINDKNVSISENESYCKITLQTLINEGYLDESSATYASGNKIPTNRIIKVTKDTYNQNQYELVKTCEETE